MKSLLLIVAGCQICSALSAQIYLPNHFKKKEIKIIAADTIPIGLEIVGMGTLPGDTDANSLKQLDKDQEKHLRKVGRKFRSAAVIVDFNGQIPNQQFRHNQSVKEGDIIFYALKFDLSEISCIIR